MNRYTLNVYDLTPEQAAHAVSLLQEHRIYSWLTEHPHPPEDHANDNAEEAQECVSGRNDLPREPVEQKTTLRDLILNACDEENGCSRRVLKDMARSHGFNVGSVSPTLVSLATAKRLKRIGKPGSGVYQTHPRFIWNKRKA